MGIVCLGKLFEFSGKDQKVTQQTHGINCTSGISDTIRYTHSFFQKNVSFETLTHRKINIEPENDGLEDDFPFPGVYSQVPC